LINQSKCIFNITYTFVFPIYTRLDLIKPSATLQMIDGPFQFRPNLPVILSSITLILCFASV